MDATASSSASSAGFPVSPSQSPVSDITPRAGFRDDVPGEDWSLFYPCSDGEPVADNTEQLDWMMIIIHNLLYLLRDRTAFVAGDLLWYPVQNNNKFCLAPDVMVALGRPQHHRRSYIQSREGGIAPQVAFEILSPKNTKGEMEEKLRLYEQHGVQEYYVYDPDTPRDPEESERESQGKRKVRFRLQGYRRQGQEGRLAEIPQMNGWVSPLLGIRFQFDAAKGLELFHPNGKVFTKYTKVAVELDETKEELDETKEELDETKEELGDVKGKLNETTEKLNEAADELGKVKTDRDVIVQELDQVTSERDDLAQERDKMAEKQAEMTKRLEAALAELEALRKGLHPMTPPSNADSSVSSDADKAS